MTAVTTCSMVALLPLSVAVLLLSTCGILPTTAKANEKWENPHPPIPLWPDGRIPGERPGTIGKEQVTCRYRNKPNEPCRDRTITNVTFSTLTPFLVAHSDAAVIIAPGGSYHDLAFDLEGTDIARWLTQSVGISAFVLKYRVPERPWLPFGAAPLMDAQRAMGVVRKMAGTTLLPQLNKSKVGFLGFSAGAHLTGHLNVAWDHRIYQPHDSADQESCRPDFSIMVYPWKSVSQEPVHQPNATALQITNQTPPTLLIQTEDDPVHVENSIYYYLALKQKGAAPSELHVYPRGGHGYGRCSNLMAATKETNSSRIPHTYEVCSWPDRAHAFLKMLGVVPQYGMRLQMMSLRHNDPLQEQ
ncbi:alpha/beta hydrolase fold [Seminavis robusta]|uniref:Alpha/beta hydrolase fold n=1 Tax=Seminavis robusta TaxID=568900 RepID=A0A9N8HEY7_9STRA|nr:alpha/beta hydrolase fold [Seminavis robusta]|eukprot:Sro324_g117620.1 alpha/beta hydrolase fold (358) ;mRNA; r:55854-56927